MRFTATQTGLETLVESLGHAGWQAAVLAMLVLLVPGEARERLEARWRFCLWLVVLARLALPITPVGPGACSAWPTTATDSATSSPAADVVPG
jgi:beta-lactamase regulating signal transducer with metallopeptidase domain